MGLDTFPGKRKWGLEKAKKRSGEHTPVESGTKRLFRALTGKNKRLSKGKR